MHDPTLPAVPVRPLRPVGSARITCCVATSLDGYIARSDGSIDWLADPDAVAFDFPAYLARIGTLVMGRRTYEDAIGSGEPWPYTGKRCVVLTHRPIEAAPIEVESMAGATGEVIARLQSEADGDVWILGGGAIITAALDAGLLDELIVAVHPRILGEGRALFAPHHKESLLSLQRTATAPNGVTVLTYAIER